MRRGNYGVKQFKEFYHLGDTLWRKSTPEKDAGPGI